MNDVSMQEIRDSSPQAAAGTKFNAKIVKQTERKKSGSVGINECKKEKSSAPEKDFDVAMEKSCHCLPEIVMRNYPFSTREATNIFLERTENFAHPSVCISTNFLVTLYCITTDY